VPRSAEVSMLSRTPKDGPCPVAIGAVDTTMPVCACRRWSHATCIDSDVQTL
jgi:hypothetical protein